MSSKTRQSGKLSNNRKNIQVFVRVRPVTEKELLSVVRCEGTKDVVVEEKPGKRQKKTFTFDHVFGAGSSQLDVFNVVQPMITEILAGYNCTVFAYGQTGSGKTFTMEGAKSNDSVLWEDDPFSSGIIPRSVSHLFDKLESTQAEYSVRVSFLELYNEEIFDLLSPVDDATKLRSLFQDKTQKGSVIVQGLKEEIVHSKFDVYRIMLKGCKKRATSSTMLNAESSRSHTIFSVIVQIKEGFSLKTGKLNLVDLAGSENIRRSGASSKQALEAGNINRSLLTLGRCIEALVEHRQHIPFRESKLTRLLQQSLGGCSKTSIIATISPAMVNLEETLSTLHYARRARNITNQPEINQKEFTDEEITRLRAEWEASRQKEGVYITHEKYAQMLTQIERQEEEILKSANSIETLKEEINRKERDYCNDRTRLIQERLAAEEILTQQVEKLTAAVNEMTEKVDAATQVTQRESSNINSDENDNAQIQEIENASEYTMINGFVTQRTAGGSGSNDVEVPEPICVINESIQTHCVATNKRKRGSEIVTDIQSSKRRKITAVKKKCTGTQIDEVGDSTSQQEIGQSAVCMTQASKFMCLCGSIFQNQEELRQHRRKHSRDRPFLCPVCDSAFKFKSYLARHVNQNHGLEKTFTCALCNTSFQYFGYLQRHLNSQRHVINKLWHRDGVGGNNAVEQDDCSNLTERILTSLDVV